METNNISPETQNPENQTQNEDRITFKKIMIAIFVISPIIGVIISIISSILSSIIFSSMISYSSTGGSIGIDWWIYNVIGALSFIIAIGGFIWASKKWLHLSTKKSVILLFVSGLILAGIGLALCGGLILLLTPYFR